MKKKLLIAGLVSVMLMTLAGCGKTTDYSEYGTVDQIYETEEKDVTIYAFRYGDKYIETESFREIEVSNDVMPTDGAFYIITADVTYLDGGVAGYTHYPQIDRVLNSTEISIDELSFPSIEEEKYGLLSISDYADADYLLNAMGNRAVYKEGKWIYRYEKNMAGNDYENIFYNGDITKDEIYEGVAKGIVCCEDYFVMPVK